jgi:hypothetical protein
LSYLNQLKITLKEGKYTETYIELNDLYDKTLINFDALGSLYIEKSKEGCHPNHCDDNYIFKCNDDFSLVKEYIIDNPINNTKNNPINNLKNKRKNNQKVEELKIKKLKIQ